MMRNKEKTRVDRKVSPFLYAFIHHPSSILSLGWDKAKDAIEGLEKATKHLDTRTSDASLGLHEVSPSRNESLLP